MADEDEETDGEDEDEEEEKPGGGLKMILIAVGVLVVLIGGGGGGAYMFGALDDLLGLETAEQEEIKGGRRIGGDRSGPAAGFL